MTVAVILVGIAIGVFALSLSRAGMIAFVVELIVGALILRSYIFGTGVVLRTGVFLKKIAVVGAMILIAWGTFFLLQNIKENISEKEVGVVERLAFSDTTGGASFSERKEFFTGSLELMKRETLLGYGPSSFKWVYPQVQKGFLSISDHPHNVLLKYGVERGVPAALFFLLFLLILFLYENPFSAKTSLIKKVAWIGLIGALAHSMVDYNLNFISNLFLFWFLLTLIATRSADQNTTEISQLNPTRVLSRILVFLFSFSLIAFIFISGLLLIRDSRQYHAMFDKGEITAYLDRFNPILPRWQLLRLDDYAKRFPSLRKILLGMQLQKNPYDIESYIRLAMIAESEGRSGEAALFYREAISRNPKNTFQHYLGYARTGLSAATPEEKAAFKAQVIPLIEEYKKLYDKNLHYTSRTNEIEYVRELEDYLD